jgi:hypothetical protein
MHPLDFSCHPQLFVHESEQKEKFLWGGQCSDSKNDLKQRKERVSSLET